SSVRFTLHHGRLSGACFLHDGTRTRREKANKAPEPKPGLMLSACSESGAMKSQPGKSDRDGGNNRNRPDPQYRKSARFNTLFANRVTLFCLTSSAFFESSIVIAKINFRYD